MCLLILSFPVYSGFFSNGDGFDLASRCLVASCDGIVYLLAALEFAVFLTSFACG